jgi:hypothetical protein
MAGRALANVWVRIIHTMWLKQERYSAVIFTAAQQTNAGHAA